MGWLRERADPGHRVVPGAVPTGVAVGVQRGGGVRPDEHRVPGGVRAGHRDHRRLPVLRRAGRLPGREGQPVRRPGHQQPRVGQGGRHRRLLRREHRHGAGVRLAHRQRGQVRVGPPRVGATRRVETRTVALGIREHLMNWTPTDGTEAISSWLNQGVLFALVLAVATVIGCAVVWAVGSLTANGAAAGRGRTGIVVALAAALLLGAGFSYLQWISTTQAAAFAGDPDAVRHRRHPGHPRRVGVPGPVRAVDGQHQHRPRQGRTAAVPHRRCTDREGQVAAPTAEPGRAVTARSTPSAARQERGMVYGAWDYGARRPGQADPATCPRTSSATRTRGAARASRSRWMRRRTCGRRGSRCGTTRTRRPSSWRCWKTVRDWRCGTNARNSDE